MLVSFNPSISNNQNICKKKQNPAFKGLVNRVITPTNIGDLQDLFMSFRAERLKPDKKTLLELNKAYLECEEYLRGAFRERCERMGLPLSSLSD